MNNNATIEQLINELAIAELRDTCRLGFTTVVGTTEVSVVAVVKNGRLSLYEADYLDGGKFVIKPKQNRALVEAALDQESSWLRRIWEAAEV